MQAIYLSIYSCLKWKISTMQKKKKPLLLHQPNINLRKARTTKNQTLHKEGQFFAVCRMFHNPPMKAQANYQVKGWTENRNACQDLLKTIIEMVPVSAGAHREVFIAQLGCE